MLSLTVLYQFFYSQTLSRGRHEDPPKPLEIFSNWILLGGGKGGKPASAGKGVPWHPSIRSGERGGREQQRVHTWSGPSTHLSLFFFVRYSLFLSLHERPFFDTIFAHHEPNNGVSVLFLHVKFFMNSYLP
jgi:hypothetical protein